MLNMNDYIKEPNNAKEVKEHLMKGKLCLQKLLDATVLMYKDNEKIVVLTVRTGGKVERSFGLFEYSMNALDKKRDELGLPALLNREKNYAEELVDTLILYETVYRNN